VQSLRQRQIALISKRSLHQFLTNTQILEPVKEIAVGHLDVQFLKTCFLVLVPVEAHMVQPCEFVYMLYLRIDQLSCDLALVDKVSDELLVLFSDLAGEVVQDTLSQHLQGQLNVLLSQ